MQRMSSYTRVDLRHQGSISSHSKTSGALGPDVSAFIGRIFVLDPPPEHQLDLVDIPIFTQGEDTPLGLLMQVDEEDLSEYSKQRLRAVTSSQEEISVSVLRENSHIDPLQQINAARTIRQQAAELHRFLAWNGIPDYEQLRKTMRDYLRSVHSTPQQWGILWGAASFPAERNAQGRYDPRLYFNDPAAGQPHRIRGRGGRGCLPLSKEFCQRKSRPWRSMAFRYK